MRVIDFQGLMVRTALLLLMATPFMAQAAETADPYQWLEDVGSERALTWVRQRNAESRKVIEAHPRFTQTRDAVRKILDSRDRIPMVTRRGDWLYNFWRDDANPRGLWRRATLAEYRKPQPAWQTLIDLDQLAKAESENWVWSGANCLGPDYRRCLVSLSRGGADAHVTREFDLVAKTFVADGFHLPEAKSRLDWLDRDTLLVGTDFGPGSLTDSGYPRVIKRWKRGQPLTDAKTVFEAKASDVSADVSVDHAAGWPRTVLSRTPAFFTELMWLLDGDQLIAVAKPDDAQLSFWRDRVLLKLRSDWTVAGRTHLAGSLLVADAKAYLAGSREFTTLFAPTATRSLAGFTATRDALVLELLDNVAGRLEEWRPGDKAWTHREIQAPFPGTISAMALADDTLAEDPLADLYFVSYTDFLTPDSLSLGRIGSDERQLLKSRPAFFDAAGMKVEQRFAASRDGTKVPYFVVWPRGAKADGTNPTLLYGYGGFEVSLNPWYSAAFGTGWYAHGGVLVVANIRGGGEFGPAWHQAAVGPNRQRAYDDFIAVAQDLIKTGVTDARHLGIEGGSNGGLLVGAVMVQRPDLFNAVVCQVPLLDMRRYNQLLAGASWMAEYGNPDKPEEWAWIAPYSPYQNVRADQKLPKVLFTTSTRDDRVHPGHARKMAARMAEQGHALLYYENIEGGHGGAADNAQRADLTALELSFLWLQLGRN